MKAFLVFEHFEKAVQADLDEGLLIYYVQSDGAELNKLALGFYVAILKLVLQLFDQRFTQSRSVLYLNQMSKKREDAIQNAVRCSRNVSEEFLSEETIDCHNVELVQMQDQILEQIVKVSVSCCFILKHCFK